MPDKKYTSMKTVIITDGYNWFGRTVSGVLWVDSAPGARQVLRGARQVLRGARRVLRGARRVLRGARRVLRGARQVLRLLTCGPLAVPEYLPFLHCRKCLNH